MLQYTTKNVKTKPRILLICIILGLFSFRWIIQDNSFIDLGYGLSIDGLRSYLIFLIGFITLGTNAIKMRKCHISAEIMVYSFFLIWAICSIFWSISFSYSVRDAIKLVYPLCIYLITRIHVRNIYTALWLEKKIYKYIGILIFISAVLLVISILFDWNNPISQNNKMMRITDNSGLYNIGIGAIVIYIIHYLIIARKNGWKDLLFNYKIWLPFIIIIITITRSYIIATISAIISAIVLSKKTSFSKLVFSIIIIFLVSVSIVMLIEPIKSRMFWHPSDVSIVNIIQNPQLLIDGSYIKSSGRFRIWSYYINTLHNCVSPIIGGGIGTVRYVLSGGSIFGIAAPHGEYSKYIAELGYFGFAFYIFCLLFFVTAICAKAVKTENVFAKRQYILALACFIYIIICGIGYTPFYNSFGFVEIIFAFLAMADNIYAFENIKKNSRVFTDYAGYVHI